MSKKLNTLFSLGVALLGLLFSPHAQCDGG